MFDVAIHAMNSVLLFPYISTTEGSVTNSEWNYKTVWKFKNFYDPQILREI